MNRILKSTVVIAALLVALLVTTISVSAATSYPYNESRRLTTTTSWQTIASSTTGFNCNVYIYNLNTGTSGLGIARSDVRMLGSNGTVVWEESGALPGAGDRTFWCGGDVYTIQIRTQTGKGTAYARPA